MRVVVAGGCPSPDRLSFDAAERKGIGHPDSLADLIADTFSRRYAAWCLDEFGLVPNHWVDKVNLVGAGADVTFGGFKILKPIDCYLFGKVTDEVGSSSVPVHELFEDSVGDVLARALGSGDILRHVRLHVNNTRGVAVDHDPQFYRPAGPEELTGVLRSESVANDTVLCVGASHRGLAADLAVRLETHVTGTEFHRAVPGVGTDVKVMVVRVGSDLDITIAVPFRPELTESWTAYRDNVADVQTALLADLKALLDQEPRARAITDVSLHVNTKDVPGRGYIAPFGTSLGKGDCGAVGRGNGYSGVIEPFLGASSEAPAGKNPVHHVGKIYAAVATEIAQRIMVETSAFAEVTLAARNGGLLTDPAYALVSVDQAADHTTTATIEQIVHAGVSRAADFTDRFLATDPIVRFREGAPR